PQSQFELAQSTCLAQSLEMIGELVRHVSVILHVGCRSNSLPGIATRAYRPHTAGMTDTNTVIEQFNEAFRLREPEMLVDIIADDCVMEGVGPAPDGNRGSGYDECLAGWQGLIREPSISFEVEHVDVDGDRAVIRWRLHSADAPFRGVNLMRVRDGKIVEAL